MATRRPKLESSGRRVIAYLRTSTDKQDLAAQQTGIVEFAKRNGFQPIAFYEEQVSGRTPVKPADPGSTSYVIGFILPILISCQDSMSGS